jgi:hypothetical protein
MQFIGDKIRPLLLLFLATEGCVGGVRFISPHCILETKYIEKEAIWPCDCSLRDASFRQMCRVERPQDSRLLSRVILRCLRANKTRFTYASFLGIKESAIVVQERGGCYKQQSIKHQHNYPHTSPAQTTTTHTIHPERYHHSLATNKPHEQPRQTIDHSILTPPSITPLAVPPITPIQASPITANPSESSTTSNPTGRARESIIRVTPRTSPQYISPHLHDPTAFIGALKTETNHFPTSSVVHPQ